MIGLECSGTELMFIRAQGTQQTRTAVDSRKQIATANANRLGRLNWIRTNKLIRGRITLLSWGGNQS